MSNYVVYDTTGKILRIGISSSRPIRSQAGINEFVLEGTANDRTQKVIDGKIVDKTPEEIEAEKPKPVPVENRPARITNKQWQAVLERLDRLEEDHGRL